MSSKELLDIFDLNGQELDLETMMYISFTEYKYKRNKKFAYNFYDFIPQNLIRLYFSRDVNRSDFSNIVDNFKKKYLEQESKLENVHSEEEIAGLGVVYDYIRSDEWKKCANIYIIFLLNLKLFSLTPYPEAGGKIRNSDCILLNSGLNAFPYNEIDIGIAGLYSTFDNLVKEGLELGMNSNLNNEDKIIEYVNKCLKLKCKLIEIHPFVDENEPLVKNATYPQNAYKLGFSN